MNEIWQLSSLSSSMARGCIYFLIAYIELCLRLIGYFYNEINLYKSFRQTSCGCVLYTLQTVPQVFRLKGKYVRHRPVIKIVQILKAYFQFYVDGNNKLRYNVFYAREGCNRCQVQFSQRN